MTTRPRKPAPALLDTGDSIEVSFTQEISKRNNSSWAKYGAVGHVRPNETPEQARARIEVFVIAGLDEAVSELNSIK